MNRVDGCGLGCSRQRGGFLLEALIGILIFTLGVLGLVALQARAISYTSDAQYRGEAAYLANAYAAKMWADDRTNLAARYVTSGQPEYDALQQVVFRRLPGASLIPDNPRIELIQPPPGGSLADARGNGGGITLTSSGSLVTIEISWLQLRLEDQSGGPVQHRYTMTSILAQN
jgi:type IV pilus assembly protein PilV